MNILVLFPNDYDTLFLNQKRFPEHQFFFEGENNITSHLEEFCIQSFIAKIKQKYPKIDAVITSQDYPGILAATILAGEIGIPACTPEATITLQHKYYSRLTQCKHLPEDTPRFTVVSIDENISHREDLFFPCFIKPVKAVFSFLTAQIDNKQQLQEFIDCHREELRAFSQPFNDILAQYPQFTIDANHFILEEVLKGTQVTLDGFCHNGDVTIMGIVDSIMYPGTESFRSFEYPSKLPKDVQQRMITMAKTFVSNSGYNSGMFNLEMFYDSSTNKIDIIEVNPRIFFAAADYFEKVQGVNTYETCVDIALGKKPHIPNIEGEFKVAATFTPRLFEDKFVQRIPTAEEIAQLKKQFPDLILKLEHKAGQRLSDTIQSSGSYKYAVLNLGADSWQQLYDKYDQVMSMLNFEFI
ncbi:ATP-grasp domain-containing protein [Candidatus Uabimicrobium amorphum]|uniref:ATP-grasp domain-containing protein n=1 Tax=Uabimicrobium amorphum TaxID=2596890 RepID=A0A5S9F3U8_UABAM|nr:ATP-grasp domain-containing protein [Candidatus Uabimicrobium amorphum]BBM84631.1 hypothetical protein UABAM_02992 [Candidatus Uabimicrobium amorphum]